MSVQAKFSVATGVRRDAGGEARVNARDENVARGRVVAVVAGPTPLPPTVEGEADHVTTAWSS